MTDYSDSTRWGGGCASERVLGEHIAYVMYRLMDPMEARHYWWQINQQIEADEAELRRTGAPGYNQAERLL